MRRHYFAICALLIFGSFGCSTKAEDPNKDLKAKWVKITPLQSTSKKHRTVSQFITDNKNRLYAFEKAINFDRHRNPLQMEGSLLYSDNHFKTYKSANLRSAPRLSNLLKLTNGDFLLHSLNIRQSEEGPLKVFASKSQLVIDKEKVTLKSTPYEFSIDEPVYREGALLSKEDSSDVRRKLRNIYKQHLHPHFNYDPYQFKDAHGVHLYVHSEFESGIYTSGRKMYKSLKPLDTRLSASANIQMCQSNNETQYAIAWGTSSQLAPLYNLIQKTAVHEDKHQRYLILSLHRGKVALFHEYTNKNSHHSLHHCTMLNHSLYLVGSLENHKGLLSHRKQVWVQKINATGVHSLELALPKHAFGKTIAVDPKSGSVYVGGSFNFHQARHGGSVSHMDGFVIALDQDLKLQQKFYLKGQRTTRVHSLHLNKHLNTNTLYIGGSTDGPHTHSSNNATKSFITTLQLNPSEGGN